MNSKICVVRSFVLPQSTNALVVRVCVSTKICVSRSFATKQTNKPIGTI